MKRLTAVTLVGAALLALAPAASQAAVAGRSFEGESLIYSADPAETNQLTVSLDGNRLVFDDPGATIAAESGCTQVSTTRVSCEVSAYLSVELGDRDDEATLATGLPTDLTIWLSGEQGNDTLHGSGGRNSISGDAGEDVLDPGPGTESISAATTLSGGTPYQMPEVIGDRDTINCVPPSTGVYRSLHVDAADVVNGDCGTFADLYTDAAIVIRGTDGPDQINGSYYPTQAYGLGGDDTMSATGTEKNRMDGGTGNDTIESGGLLLGGEGDDRLSSGIANDIPVRQDGGPGNDVLLGRYGNDRLTGGPGADRISGNSGSDYINARDGERDSVRCGQGRKDRVVADRIDSVARDCEKVTRSAVASSSTVRPAASARSRCRAASTAKGTRIVRKTSSAVVFERRGGVFGCTYSGGRVAELIDEGGGIDTRHLVITGRYAGYTTLGSAIGDEFDRVVVWDLRTGRLRYEVGSNSVTSFVVKSNGSFAWIQYSTVAPADQNRSVYELHEFSAVDREGDLLVARGSDISPKSLALSADKGTINWTQGGIARTAPLR